MSNVRPLLGKQQQALVASGRRLPRERARALAYRARVLELVDDMESAGDEGLLWAAADYSPAEGTAFDRFARVVIDRAICSFLRSEMRHRRLDAAGYVLATWGAAQVPTRSADVLRALEDAEEEALGKLRRFVDLKVIAGAAMLCAEYEGRAEAAQAGLELNEAMRIVREELATYPEAEQRLFAGIYWEGLTVEDAGARAGLAKVSAKSRLRGLLGRLRKALVAAGFEGMGG